MNRARACSERPLRPCWCPQPAAAATPDDRSRRSLKQLRRPCRPPRRRAATVPSPRAGVRRAAAGHRSVLRGVGRARGMDVLLPQRLRRRGPARRAAGRGRARGGSRRVPASGLVVHRQLPTGRETVRTDPGDAARARGRRAVRAPAGRACGHLRRDPLRPRRRRPLHHVPLDDAGRRHAADAASASRRHRRPRQAAKQLRGRAGVDQPRSARRSRRPRGSPFGPRTAPRSPSMPRAQTSGACRRAPSTGTAPKSRGLPPRLSARAPSPTRSSSCSTAPATLPRRPGRATRSPATSRRWPSISRRTLPAL